MTEWTNSGTHRLCCLKCGHLFGYECIYKWLHHSCNSTNRRCPQCNKTSSVKHIRLLYAKNVTAIDTTELEKLKEALTKTTAAKENAEREVTKYDIRQKLYEQQLSHMKAHISELKNYIAELKKQSLDVSIHTDLSISKDSAKKFCLQHSIGVSKEGGCRILAYNPWHKTLVASQKLSDVLYAGYGIKKFDSDKFQLQQSVFLHSKTIRDLKFHPIHQTLLLSVSFDKDAKLMDIQNNITVHTYKTEYPLWSCCISGDNPNNLLVGAQDGSINQFDIRQTSSAVCTLYEISDRSPVVSLAAVPPTPGSGINRGGFLACRLNTCHVYEVKDDTYLPKQVFLEGPFVSLCYDNQSNHVLISSRPNAKQPFARHTVCTIEKGNEETVICNVVHTFEAGKSQRLLSRPCHMYVDNDTLIAAYQESNSSVSLWSTTKGEQLYNIPVSDPIMDVCSFTVNNDLFLGTLSAQTLQLYNYQEVT